MSPAPEAGSGGKRFRPGGSDMALFPFSLRGIRQAIP
jgi:hypothetical protein